MFRRWPFSLTLKGKKKIPIHYKVIAILLNYVLVSPYITSHARLRRVIPANARSESHFKIQNGYFGYCRFPLNTEKLINWPISFCKRDGLKRLWRNLPICVKIGNFNPFFLMKLTISKLLKQYKWHFPSSTCTAKTYYWFRKCPYRINLQKWHISHFLCKIGYTTFGGRQY